MCACGLGRWGGRQVVVAEPGSEGGEGGERGHAGGLGGTAAGWAREACVRPQEDGGQRQLAGPGQGRQSPASMPCFILGPFGVTQTPTSPQVPALQTCRHRRCTRNAASSDKRLGRPQGRKGTRHRHSKRSVLIRGFSPEMAALACIGGDGAHIHVHYTLHRTVGRSLTSSQEQRSAPAAPLACQDRWTSRE